MTQISVSCPERGVDEELSKSLLRKVCCANGKPQLLPPLSHRGGSGPEEEVRTGQTEHIYRTAVKWS